MTVDLYAEVTALEERLLGTWTRRPGLRAAWTPNAGEFFAARTQAVAAACAAVADLSGNDLGTAVMVALASAGKLKLWPPGSPVMSHEDLPDPIAALERWRDLRSLIALRKGLQDALAGIETGQRLSDARGAILEALRASEAQSATPAYSDAELMGLALTEVSSRETGGHTTGFDRIDTLTGGLRPGHVWVVGAPTNWGKCVGPDTLVLRADGVAVVAREVRIGDELMGPDSRPRRVIGTTRGCAEMFRIVPRRGEPWECNADHILVVADSANGGAVTEISVADFMQRAPSWRKTQKLFHAAVEYPRHDPTPVDPWMLGVWYGDGTKCLHTVEITTPDSEVVNGLIEQAELWGLRVSQRWGAGAWRCRMAGEKGHSNPLLSAIRYVVGDQERLPRAYTHGSRDTRLQFLAGWIDSDGHRKCDRFCEIVTQHETWARQLRLLCRSLGLQAHIYRKTNVPGYESCVYWRLHIAGDLSVIPTRVGRKRFPWKRSHKDPNRVGFRVEPVGMGEFCGWELDGDGLFLLADFTVSHNSSLALAVLDHHQLNGRRALMVSCEDAPELLATRLLCRRARLPGGAARDGRLTESQLAAAECEVARAADRGPAPVLIDGRGRDCEHLAGDIRAAARAHGVGLVLVDYLQCITTGRETQDRRAEINHIARTLTDAIKTSNCAGILLSQLTGEDIRESRDVEHAAEVVLIGRKDESGLSLFVKKNKCGPKDQVIQLEWEPLNGSFKTDAFQYDGFDNEWQADA